MRRMALFWTVALTVLGHGEFAVCSHAAPSPGPPVVGNWAGTFNCGASPRDRFSLSVSQDGSGALLGVLTFAPEGQSPGAAGRLRLRGGPPAPDGVFTLVPDTWLERSGGANFYGLSGRIGGNGAVAEGKLLNCGQSAFIARRNASADGSPGRAEPALALPAPGGALEGRWRGRVECERRAPYVGAEVAIVVSEQHGATAVFIEETVPNLGDPAAERVRGVYVSGPIGGGGALRPAFLSNETSSYAMPREIAASEGDAAPVASFFDQSCSLGVSKEAGYPAGFGREAAALGGTWSTDAKSAGALRPVSAAMSLFRDIQASLVFEQAGDVIYGRLTAYYPANKPPSDQERLVVDLRPIFMAPDGRIGFVSTRVSQAQGVFAPGSPSDQMLSHGFVLLVRPPPEPGASEFEAGLATGARRFTQPNLRFVRREAGEAAEIAQGGVRVDLAPGVAGKLAAARSLGAQCQTLADWARPYLATPNLRHQSFDLLLRQALPLFEDEAFVPVFGLPYATMTATQRRPISGLLGGDCPRRFEMQELAVGLDRAFGAMPEGDFGFAAVSAALADRREARAKAADAAQRLPGLAATEADWREFAEIEADSTGPIALLTDPEQAAFNTLLDTTRARLARGLLEGRIEGIANLPDDAGSLDTLDKLRADVAISARSASDRAEALSQADAKARAVVAKLADDVSQKTLVGPMSLTGLAEATGVAREIARLGERAGGRQPPAAAAAAVAARRAALLADAGVKQAFRAEMDDVARQSAAPAEVFAAAARYLEPDEIQRGAAPSYQADVSSALREAEDDHDRRQAGPSAESALQRSPAAPDEAAGAEAALAPGEPTPDDMETALASIASGVDAAGDDLAARCAGRDFENDPPLAFMCLGQLASGGPTTIHFASFRKLACAQASGKPGYVCDYSLSVNLDSARDTGALAALLAAGGVCTGRFVQSGDRWALRERACR
jgi:hypothetical protein